MKRGHRRTHSEYLPGSQPLCAEPVTRAVPSLQVMALVNASSRKSKTKVISCQRLQETREHMSNFLKFGNFSIAKIDSRSRSGCQPKHYGAQGLNCIPENQQDEKGFGNKTKKPKEPHFPSLTTKAFKHKSKKNSDFEKIIQSKEPHVAKICISSKSNRAGTPLKKK